MWALRCVLCDKNFSLHATSPILFFPAFNVRYLHFFSALFLASGVPLHILGNLAHCRHFRHCSFILGIALFCFSFTLVPCPLPQTPLSRSGQIILWSCSCSLTGNFASIIQRAAVLASSFDRRGEISTLHLSRTP